MTTVLAGIIRWVLTLVGTWLAGRGIATSADVASITSNVEVIAGAVVAVAPLIWGIWKNWKSSQTVAK